MLPLRGRMAVPLLLRNIRGTGGGDLNRPSGPEDLVEHAPQRPPILLPSVGELAHIIGIKRSRFYELRERTLCDALDALVERPAGRRASRPTPA